MITFTVFCQHSDIIDLVRKTLNRGLGENLIFNVISDRAAIETHLHYEVPQFVLFDLDDPSLEAQAIVHKLVDDPLLLNVRMLGLIRSVDSRVPSIPGLFSVMSPSQIKNLLPHLVHILHSNEHLILQTGIIRELGRNGTLNIPNNPLLLEAYAELLASFVYNHNFIDMQGKYGLKFSLVEMLMNAVEHGNCNISFEEKRTWLQSGKDIVALIQQKCQDPQIAKRQVMLQYDIRAGESVFVISDEGEGFDVSSLPDPQDPTAMLELHGRGIFMTQNYVRKMAYNDKGNQVTLIVEHLKDRDHTIPEGFMDSEVLNLKSGDVVFKENDIGNTFYYIVGGEFVVMIGGKTITTLNNTNIFLGEMEFLLGSRRAATVYAKTDGCLVAINAKEWLRAVQKYPYYGLFMSRLLAQKLDKQSRRVTS